MRSLTGWLLLALALVWYPAPAPALDFALAEAGGRSLALRGEIRRGDAGRVERLLRAHGQIGAVRLDSTGGNLAEAFAIGRLLRRQGMAASVGDGAVCASACVYVLAGSPRRQVAAGGRVGVHMFASTHEGDVLAMIAQLVREHGPEGAAIVARRLERHAAVMAAEVAGYLDEMSVPLALMIPTLATPPDRIRWLTRQELRAFGLAGDG